MQKIEEKRTILLRATLIVLLLITLILIVILIIRTFNADILVETILLAATTLSLIFTTITWLLSIASIKTERYPGLSIVRIMVKRRTKGTVVALSFVIVSSIGLLLFDLVPSVFVTVFLLLLVAIIGQEALFSYRVRKGLFGRNASEAREVIEFILKNSDRIDFTDGGRPKPIISEADLEELQERLGRSLGPVGAKADA
jgi:hypothetical protein